jgi:hypothetical protein
MTTVVNLYQTREYDVYIGRAGMGEDGYFGNPYSITATRNRDDCLDAYSSYFYSRLDNDPEFKKRILELKDKKLGCFCKPQRCHGDIIAQWLDGANVEMGIGD